ncbi:MAG: hypothetical protein MR935_08000 [Agathobaculum sp.]|uniref:hypothetical protein n=1 Tax=Agathobaculum sp. TaxID=2048138 RepID=UPI0025C700F8|nr:hypothetical protein [Agathobaculum sp.]MCI7126115.1 hypothetical protein [Agathobaculum sp.]MDY3711224.1 hypothetical protein [Agathobaculum sp.]
MTHGVKPAAVFSALLSDDPAASAFFSDCTTEQKQAIRRQAERIDDPESMQAFVEHLPSAAL